MYKMIQPQGRAVQIIDVVKNDTYHVCLLITFQSLQKEYVIQVEYRALSWQIQRRYKVFDELHNQVCMACYSTHSSLKLKKSRSLPINWMDRFQLPRKKLRGNTSPTFVAERQLSLENYLQELYLDPLIFQQPELRDFLEFDKHIHQ